MQSAQHGARLHISFTHLLSAPRDGRLPIERLVTSPGVVVLDVLLQHAKQVPLPHRDDVIGALTSQRADNPLRIAYLGHFGGTLLVQPPFINVLFVGVVPPSGELELVVPAPAVGPGFDVVHAMIQPVLVGATTRIGDGGLTVVLDDVY